MRQFCWRLMCKRLGTLWLLIACTVGGAMAQSLPTHIDFRLSGGKVLPIHGSRYETFTPTISYDQSVLWRIDDDRYWTQFWHRPYMGVSLGYTQIFDQMLVNRIMLAYMLDMPLTKHLSLSFNAGLSWFTRPYRSTLLKENVFIGSYTNCLIDLGVSYNVPVGPVDDYISFGLSVVHSSCGYLYKPNHGLNTLQFDVCYRFATYRNATRPVVDRKPLSDDTFSKTLRPFFSFAPALVMSRFLDDDDHTLFFAYTFQAGAIRRFHPCFAYGGALDLSYNFSHNRQPEHVKYPVYPAASLFADVFWGRVSLRLGLAHYLDRYPLNWEQYYERVGLYYSVAHNQRVGVAMKVHYDHIDYIEWTYMIEL